MMMRNLNILPYLKHTDIKREKLNIKFVPRYTLPDFIYLIEALYNLNIIL
jgi:hypothetical protein